MIKDLIQQYQKLEERIPTLPLDVYTLSEGIYIKLSIDKSIEEQKQDVLDSILVINQKREAIRNPNLVDSYKKLDACSSILNNDSNKVIDIPARVIWSANPFTLFMKIESFNELKQLPTYKSTLTDEHLIIHTNQFLNRLDSPSITEKMISMFPFVKKNDAKLVIARETFPELMSYIDSDERESLYQRTKEFYSKNITKIREFFRELPEDIVKHVKPKSAYIKLFLDIPMEYYEKEYDLYIYPRIFSKNQFNMMADGELKGIPAIDFTVNDNKPYQFHLSKEQKVTNLVSVQEAIAQKDVYKWIESQGKMRPIFIKEEDSSSTKIVKLDKNGSIDFYENIPFTTSNIIKGFKFENHLASFNIETYPVIVDKQQLLKVISKYLFNGFLHENFLDYEPNAKPNVFTTVMKDEFMANKKALFDFLETGTTITIRPVAQKMVFQLIREKIRMAEGFKLAGVRNAYNFGMSLLLYLNIEGVKELSYLFKESYQNVKEKVKGEHENPSIENDKEFYILAGQLAYYLMYQSKAKHRSIGMFEEIVNVNNGANIKTKLRELLKHYSHAISINNFKLLKATNILLDHEIEGRMSNIDSEALLYGITSENLFLEKKSKEENDSEDRKTEDDER